MKKNKMMRIASVLLVAVLLSTCAISGTFAKYATEYTAEHTATVAKWKVSVEDVNSDATEKEFTFDIFESIYDNEHVDSGKIAPGTWGYFDIDLKNESEVDATYTIEFEEVLNGTGFNSPIMYKVDLNPTGTAVCPTSDLGLVTAGNSADVAFNMGANATIRVYWVWEFGDPANNVNDTKIGALAQNTPELITVNATITIEQVD